MQHLKTVLTLARSAITLDLAILPFVYLMGGAINKRA
jgi:hypothetical protein